MIVVGPHGTKYKGRGYANYGYFGTIYLRILVP